MMQYKVVTRKNPINKTKKFYPALVSPQPRIRRALSVKSKAVKFVRQGEETDKKAAKPAGGVTPAPVPGA